MPRYYFNMMEGRTKNIVRDIEGVALSGAAQAREEAIGLAQDITKHGFTESTRTWRVVVSDESGEEVLTVPLSEVRARKATRERARGIGNSIAKLESRFGRGVIIWMIGVAVLAVIAEAAISSMQAGDQGGYQMASSPAGELAVVAVRFQPDTSIAEINRFLASYEATLTGGPRPGDLYRLRIGDTSLPQGELAKIASRMSQDSIVAFAAVAR
jgi:hypothetical protein